MSKAKKEKKESQDPIEAMINWANSRLADDGIVTSDLGKDFCDGTNMCRLIEIITQKPFPMPWICDPKTVREKRRNIGAVLTVLKNNLYLKTGSIRADEIIWGDTHSIYTILRTINIYYDHGHLPPLSKSKKDKNDKNAKSKVGEDGLTDEERLENENKNSQEEEEKKEKKVSFAVGIDLGTTFCRYSVFHDDLVDNNNQNNVIESAIVFDGDEKVVGVVPLSLQDDENAVIITAIKRIIGRDFSDPTLAPFLDTLPYKVVEDPKTGRPLAEVPVNGEIKHYGFEELTAMLLSHIKELVSAQMGEEVVDAVISVPAYFTNAQRKATMDAGKLAGFNVLRIVNEPAAAAASYALKKQMMGEDIANGEPREVVVYDLGGGKLDVSLMHLEKGDCTTVKTSGNTHFGGIDFDRLLALRMAQDFKEKAEIDEDITKIPALMRKLTKEAEQAKIKLSTEDEVNIFIPEFYHGIDFRCHITRDEFEVICDSLFKQCLPPLEELFAGSGDSNPDGGNQKDDVKKDDIKTVIMCGGCTKIPRVQKIIKDFFGDDVEFYFADQDVTNGVAMQGAILKGSLAGFSITDTVALSLGVSNVNGGVTIIIPRGTKLPATKTTTATTSKDNQINVGFDIVEGERPMATDNIRLGHVTIAGIQQAPRGVPMIEITMTLNENGILVVTGRDLTTNASVTATVENKGNLSTEEIEDMIKKAENEKHNDDVARKRAEIKTELNFFIERAEGAINDESKISKLSSDNIEKFKSIVYECKEWAHSNPDEEPSVYQKKYNEFYYALNKIMKIH
ncbi:hypothetical protein M9Y10_044963 [Tritrichomonas musculus]|uniref:Calponin-homology (CH) domain-containing protein n=1 Tax=Tritrichomonas musculus TaxID=1915356 RepID=A0ABR2JV47_9EUKA